MPSVLTAPRYVSGCGCTSGSPYTSLVEAWKKRAPRTLASRSPLRVPSTFTSVVRTGSLW